jgi:ATP-dependent Clp protease ATP-binding subunit ClpA
VSRGYALATNWRVQRLKRSTQMFERFNPDARAAIAHAREEAAKAGRRTIGTEHLLLGLMAKPGDAADVLTPVQENAAEVRESIPPRPDVPAPPDEEDVPAPADEEVVATATAETTAEGTEVRVDEPAGSFRRGPLDGMHMTRNARRAVDLALRTAHRFRHDHVSSNHLLLSIIEQPESGAVEALKVAGIHVGTLRTDILRDLTREVPAKQG